MQHKKTNTIKESFIPERYLDIYKLIQKRKINANEICRELKVPISELNSLLFMMEIEGFCEKLPSGEYKLKGE